MSEELHGRLIDEKIELRGLRPLVIVELFRSEVLLAMFAIQPLMYTKSRSK